MWAILGDIEFELLDSPQGMEHHFAAEYAQHALISKKPRLEPISSTLDEISLDIKLHNRLGNVPQRLRQIREALVAQEPLALVMGNGEYRGPWVLVDGVTTTTKTTADGQLLSATLKLSLLEYSGQFQRKGSQLGILNGAVKPGALTLPPRLLTAAQQIAGLARTAENAMRLAQGLIGDARALISTPRSAFQMVPEIGSATHQAQGIAQALQVSANMPAGMPALARLGTDLVADIGAARAALLPPKLSTIGSQLRLADYRIGQGMQKIDEARPDLLKLTAAVAMRKV